MPLKTGDPCPDFTLAADRGPIASADLRGRPFVLFFYPKDDSTSCTREALDFDAAAGNFEAAGVTVIGVSPDSLASHAKFKTKHKLGLTLAADEERRLIEALGLWVEKSMYGRTFMGVERTTLLVGGDGRILRLWPNVKVKNHAAEVLEAARAAK